MEYENVFLAGCSGIVPRARGEGYDLDLNRGVGVIFADLQTRSAVVEHASASEGVVSVDLIRNLNRETLFQLFLNPPEGLTVTSVSGNTLADDGSEPVSVDDLADVSTSQTIVREANFELSLGSREESLRYIHGSFQADSEEGLQVIRDRIAPRFVD